jgi:hypothetical protein
MSNNPLEQLYGVFMTTSLQNKQLFDYNFVIFHKASKNWLGFESLTESESESSTLPQHLFDLFTVSEMIPRA